MTGKFRITSEIEPDQQDWGVRRWVSHPPSTGAKLLTVVEATFGPGHGHSFHKHPHQEEMIYVVAGELEQWIEREKRVLGPGDAAFIPADMGARLVQWWSRRNQVARYGPSTGSEGLQTIDVAAETPW